MTTEPLQRFTNILRTDATTNNVITDILRRARSVLRSGFDGLTLSMDLTAAHNRGHVDLRRLLAFGVGDFSHDIVGISKNIDRRTGDMLHSFLPRSYRKRTDEPVDSPDIATKCHNTPPTENATSHTTAQGRDAIRGALGREAPEPDERPTTLHEFEQGGRDAIDGESE